MPEQETIILNRLQLVDHDNGLMKTRPARVQLPTPCAQTNARGHLKGYESMPAFRAQAKAVGEAYRRALKS